MSDPRFEEIVTSAANDIFKVVFYPDRIYHEAYLNATRSPRYRYNVQEVLAYLDILVLKDEVYLDGNYLCDFARIEYRGTRLIEQARTQDRFLGDKVQAWLKLHPRDGGAAPEAQVALHWDRWVGA